MNYSISSVKINPRLMNIYIYIYISDISFVIYITNSCCWYFRHTDHMMILGFHKLQFCARISSKIFNHTTKIWDTFVYIGLRNVATVCMHTHTTHIYIYIYIFIYTYYEYLQRCVCKYDSFVPVKYCGISRLISFLDPALSNPIIFYMEEGSTRKTSAIYQSATTVSLLYA